MPFSVFRTEICGKPLEIEIGKLALLANGSCLVRFGETVILATVTMSDKPREGIDFFPLVVDFEEKLYSVGKIPGSFSKREGKPSEKAILISRLIDRSIRPLFPHDMKNDVAVVCTALSVSGDYAPEIASIIGTSVALSVSDIPWNGPVSSTLVGLINNEISVNPSESQINDESDLNLIVSSTFEKILMIEAGANQIKEDNMFDCIIRAHEVNKKIIDFIGNIADKLGKPKLKLDDNCFENDELKNKVFLLSRRKIEESFYLSDKSLRDKRISEIKDEVFSSLTSEYSDCSDLINEYIYDVQKSVVRDWIFKYDKRVDGRALDEIRPLSSEVGLLPKVHGSSLFTRGKTQVLNVVTLAPLSEYQFIDGISKLQKKYYIHHYNFPSYSVGEARPLRAPGRREIGHGALAERALKPVIPPVSEFPYTIRSVSEVLSSNGSTSQASVCASTLALMDAGVPISEPVAGISCGLITSGDNWKTIVDIQGIEDFFGDMDFKVAGTKNGITAIQVDVKIDGLLPEIVREAFEITRCARLKILDECMLKTISEPRAHVADIAPKILSYKIPIDKIRDVIGVGGKVVQKLCSDFGVVIDVEDDGTVFVSSDNIHNCEEALDCVKNIIRDISVGDVVSGRISRITNFGVFAEIAPGKEGMCHISKLSDKRVERITDLLKIGDTVTFKVLNIDDKGRIDLRRISSAESFYQF